MAAIKAPNPTLRKMTTMIRRQLRSPVIVMKMMASWMTLEFRMLLLLA
jgi:hypothetical protein